MKERRARDRKYCDHCWLYDREYRHATFYATNQKGTFLVCDRHIQAFVSVSEVWGSLNFLARIGLDGRAIVQKRVARSS